MNRAHYQTGSVVLDPRIDTWFFRWRDADGKRRAYRIGPRSQYPTKAEAQLAAEPVRAKINQAVQPPPGAVTLSVVIGRYMQEKLPPRFSTREGYLDNLKNHILPRWGNVPVAEIKPYPVQRWLDSLALAPKTRANIKSVLGILIECAMLWEFMDVGRNPMELVTIKGCTLRQEEPRVLTVAEFRGLLAGVTEEPFRSMLLFDMCVGLRISELLAMQWQDFDWNNGKVWIRRAIVRQVVGDVKTRHSRKPMPVDAELAEIMLVWRGKSQFNKPEDWVWASPAAAGEKPYCYTTLFKVITKAGESAGLGVIGWHTLRHSYRSWLDDTGAPMTVQQNLMRHSDIRTTMNIYGDALPETLRTANSKVVRMALPN